MRIFLVVFCFVILFWIVSLEVMMFPYLFGEHQIVMLATGSIFALVGVFVILLLVDTIRRISR